ncbi:MAG: ABC transporter permease [Chloroflexi bacterium]|nr:ABC transporter permease [Chloroflexota bacterium]
MNFLYMTIKDLKILLRDRGAMVNLFLTPLMFIVVLSLALGPTFRGPSDSAIRIPVVDEDQSAQSQQIVDALKAIKGVTTETQITDANAARALTRVDAEDLLRNGRRVGAVIIPRGFGEMLARGETARVIVLQDPAQANMANVVMGVATGVIAQVLGDEAARRGADAFFKSLESVLKQLPPQAQSQFDLKKIQDESVQATRHAAENSLVKIETASVAARRVETPGVYEQNVPGMSVMFLFFIVNYVASSILTEKRAGTFRRLMVAPISKPAILAGKLIPNFLMGVIQLTVMFTIGHFVFGMKLGNDLFALALISAAVALAATGLGILVAAVARSEEQIGGLTTLVILTLCALGGTMVPLFVMPDFMQTLARITPHAWALLAYQDVIVRGLGTLQVLPNVTVLLGFAGIFFALALWKFRFE